MNSPARFTKEARKDMSVESLRGLIILLVVMFHCINDRASPVFVHFGLSLHYVLMPVFAAISGFVYAYRPVQKNGLRSFISNKFARLLVPFAAVASLQYLVQSVFSGSTAISSLKEIWRIFIYGYAHFWFLQSIALVFFAVAILDILHALNKIRAWILSLLIAAAIAIALPLPASLPVPIDGFFYLFPYFLFGCGINRFQEVLADQRIIIATALLAIVGLVLQQFGKYHPVGIRLDTHGPMATIVGISVITVLFRARRNNLVFQKLGDHSYAIYLFHGFGIALGEKIASHSAATDIYALVFVIKAAAAVLVSLFIETAMQKNRVLRRIFLGVQ